MAWLHRSILSAPQAWLAVAVLAAGCSTDLADVQQTGGTTADTGLSAGTTEGPGECATTGSPDCDTSGGDGTGGLTGGGTGPDGMDPEDPCTDVECNADGAECYVDAEMVPHCSCPDGTVDVALRCVPCEEVAGGDYSVDLAPVPTRIDVTFYRGGEAIVSTPYDVGEIALRNRQTGDEIVLGTTLAETLEAPVLPGVYDVEYRSIESSGVMPANVAGRLKSQVEVPVQNTVDLPVVPAYVALNLTIDGGMPASDGELGHVLLRREGNPRDVFEVLSTDGAAAAVAVLPGRYEVLYRAVSTISAGGKLPKNTEAIVPDAVVEVEGGEGIEVPVPFDIEIPTFTATLSLTIDGEIPPVSEAEYGRIHLVDLQTGAATSAGTTKNPMGIVSVGPLIPGTYEIYYERVESQSGLVPANRWVRIGEPRDWTDASGNVEVTENVALNTQQVSIDVTLGGAAVDPADGVAEIWLRGEDPKDEIFVGRTNDPDLSVRVVPGTYRVLYRVAAAGTKLPENGVGDLGSIYVSVDGPAQHVVDLAAATVSGSITVSGGAAPDSQYERGWLVLFDPESGARVVLGDTSAGSFLRRVLPQPGPYQLRYEVEQGGQVVPANADAIVQEEVTIDVAEAVDLDVALAPLSLGIVPEFQNAPVPPTVDWGTIWLRDVRTGARFPVGASTGTTDRMVLPGTYVVEYQAEETAEHVLPRNSRGAVGCIVVQ